MQRNALQQYATRRTSMQRAATVRYAPYQYATRRAVQCEFRRSTYAINLSAYKLEDQSTPKSDKRVVTGLFCLLTNEFTHNYDRDGLSTMLLKEIRYFKKKEGGF